MDWVRCHENQAPFPPLAQTGAQKLPFSAPGHWVPHGKVQLCVSVHSRLLFLDTMRSVHTNTHPTYTRYSKPQSMKRMYLAIKNSQTPHTIHKKTSKQLTKESVSPLQVHSQPIATEDTSGPNQEHVTSEGYSGRGLL